MLILECFYIYYLSALVYNSLVSIGREVSFRQSSWNQTSPFNSYSPAAAGDLGMWFNFPVSALSVKGIVVGAVATI